MRADRAKLVIQPVGQVILVRAVIRRGVEEIVADDLRAVLPPAALQRMPGRLERRAERADRLVWPGPQTKA